MSKAICSQEEVAAMLPAIAAPSFSSVSRRLAQSGTSAIFAILLLISASRPAAAQTAYQFKYSLGRPVLDAPLPTAIDAGGNIFVGCHDQIVKLDKNGNFVGKIGSAGSGKGQFNYIAGITVDLAGNILVADNGNDRIQKFDSQGNFLLAYGRTGDGPGQFHNPCALRVDKNGYTWVADSGNHRIQRFDRNGKFVFTFGSNDPGDGILFNPNGLAIDSRGNVLVADSLLDRVVKFDGRGNFLARYDVFGPVYVDVDAADNFYVTNNTQSRVYKFDKSGNSLGILLPKILAVTVTVESSGNLLITDPVRGLLQEIDVNGKVLRQFGYAQTSDPGNFFHPYGLTLDANANLFVVDENAGLNNGGGRVQRFSPSGALLTRMAGTQIGNAASQQPADIAVDSLGNLFGTGNSTVRKFDSAGNFLGALGSFGSAPSQFNACSGVAMDASGNIFVADTYNHRIQAFDKNGKLILKIGAASSGTANGYFNMPTGIALDAAGNIYVTDTGNNRVQVFNAKGAFLYKFGTPGTGNGQFSNPTGIAVDTIGNIYVADPGNNRVQKFDRKAAFVTSLTDYGWGDAVIDHPNGVAVDAFGDVFITDYAGNHVVALAPISPLPSLVSLSPNQVLVGSPAQVIEINGTNFVGTTKILFGATALATTYVSPTQLKASLPASLMTTAGIVNVTAVNPAPGGGTSNIRTFTIANPRPAVTTLTPPSVLINSPTTTLTIGGTNFLPTSTVNFGNSVLPATYVSPKELTVSVPAAMLKTAASVPVYVTNPAPGGISAGARNFLIANPLPAISTSLPATIAAGSAATVVQLSGTGFMPISKVLVNGVETATTLVGTRLSFTLAASQLASPVGLSITVQNPGPGGGTSQPYILRVLGPTTLAIVTTPAPTITKSDAGLTVTYTIKNTGKATAWDIRTIAGKLNTTATTSTMPVTVTSLAAGAVAKVSLTFPLSAAAAGTTPTLHLSYTSTNAGSANAAVVCGPVPQ